MRVAHRVFEEEVRHGVAQLRVAGRGVALQLAVVAAVLRRVIEEALIDRPDTRMCRPTSLPFRRGRRPALRDRRASWVMSSSRLQIILIGTPGNCFAMATDWRT
jgi:hypothetical protein